VYKIKKNIQLDLNITQKEMAEIVGVSENWISLILTGKKKCSKMVAYAITKTIFRESEIEDYFERV